MNNVTLLNAAVIQANTLIAAGLVPIIAALLVRDQFDVNLQELVVRINK